MVNNNSQFCLFYRHVFKIFIFINLISPLALRDTCYHDRLIDDKTYVLGVTTIPGGEKAC